MFVRLLVRSTIISSAGVCVVRFAKLHSAGSETDGAQPSRFPRVEGKIERSTKRDLYIENKPAEATVSSVFKMDYKEEADMIAQKAYNIYKSADWKIAKVSVSRYYNLFCSLFFCILFHDYYKLFKAYFSAIFIFSFSLFFFFHFVLDNPNFSC